MAKEKNDTKEKKLEDSLELNPGDKLKIKMGGAEVIFNIISRKGNNIEYQEGDAETKKISLKELDKMLSMEDVSFDVEKLEGKKAVDNTGKTNVFQKVWEKKKMESEQKFSKLVEECNKLKTAYEAKIARIAEIDKLLEQEETSETEKVEIKPEEKEELESEENKTSVEEEIKDEAPVVEETPAVEEQPAVVENKNEGELSFLKEYCEKVQNLFEVQDKALENVRHSAERIKKLYPDKAPIVDGLLQKFEKNSEVFNEKISEWKKNLEEIIKTGKITSPTIRRTVEFLVKHNKSGMKTEIPKDLSRMLFSDLTREEKFKGFEDKEGGYNSSYISNVLILMEEFRNIDKFIDKVEPPTNRVKEKQEKAIKDILDAANKMGLEFEYIPLFENYKNHLGKIQALDKEPGVVHTGVKNLNKEDIQEIFAYGFKNKFLDSPYVENEMTKTVFALYSAPKVETVNENSEEKEQNIDINTIIEALNTLKEQPTHTANNAVFYMFTRLYLKYETHKSIEVQMAEAYHNAKTGIPNRYLDNVNKDTELIKMVEEVIEINSQEKKDLEIKEYTPKNTVGYLTIPNKDGSFSELAFSKESNPTASFYQVEDLGNNKYALTFWNNERAIKDATNAPELITYPIAKNKGEGGEKIRWEAKKITTTKPALYEKQGDKFVQIEPMEIYYSEPKLSESQINKIKEGYEEKRQQIRNKYAVNLESNSDANETKYKREDFSEYQANTRTEETKKLLDYFTEVTGVEKFEGDVSTGKYISWLKDPEKGIESKNKTPRELGNEIAGMLNSPRRVFDLITEFKKELKTETNEEKTAQNTKPKIEAKNPTNIDYYLATPNQDGSFNESSAMTSYKDGASQYAFKNIGGNKFEVYINPNENSYKLILRYPDKSLDPVFDPISAYNSGAKVLQTVTPAIVELNNGKFNLISKGEMDFDEVGIKRENGKE